MVSRENPEHSKGVTGENSINGVLPLETREQTDGSEVGVTLEGESDQERAKVGVSLRTSLRGECFVKAGTLCKQGFRSRLCSCTCLFMVLRCLKFHISM